MPGDEADAPRGSGENPGESSDCGEYELSLVWGRPGVREAAGDDSSSTSKRPTVEWRVRAAREVAADAFWAATLPSGNVSCEAIVEGKVCGPLIGAMTDWPPVPRPPPAAPFSGDEIDSIRAGSTSAGAAWPLSCGECVSSRSEGEAEGSTLAEQAAEGIGERAPALFDSVIGDAVGTSNGAVFGASARLFATTDSGSVISAALPSTPLPPLLTPPMLLPGSPPPLPTLALPEPVGGVSACAMETCRPSASEASMHTQPSAAARETSDRRRRLRRRALCLLDRCVSPSRVPLLAAGMQLYPALLPAMAARIESALAMRNRGGGAAAQRRSGGLAGGAGRKQARGRARGGDVSGVR